MYIVASSFHYSFLSILSLPRVSRKTVVIGSGYIAVELAGILRALGSDVTLVVRYGHVLRSFDAMLSESLMAEMDTAGVKLVKFSKVEGWRDAERERGREGWTEGEREREGWRERGMVGEGERERAYFGMAHCT